MSKYADIEQIKKIIKKIHNYADREGSLRELETTPTIEVSKDTISRADAIKAFTLNSKGERIPFVDCDNFPVEFPLRYIVDTLAALPPAPSVVPTTEQSSMAGEWIINEPIESGFGTIFECPYCKYEVEFEPTNYCPNCGAKMKG